jgi:hypothetical protein
MPLAAGVALFKGYNMSTFYIAESQFDRLDSDSPDEQTIIEALQDVIGDVDADGVEGAWSHKGNYQFHFWFDDETPGTIFCNAYILKNPDDENDSITEHFCYYFEIERT